MAAEDQMLDQIRAAYGIDSIDGPLSKLDAQIADMRSRWGNEAGRRMFGKEADYRRMLARRSQMLANPGPRHAEAEANKTVLNGMFTSQRDAAMRLGTGDLDHGLWKTVSTNRQTLAGQGLAGGSVDADTGRRTIANYLQGRNQLRSNINDNEATARHAVDDQRMALESSVKLGQPVNMQLMDTIGRQRSAINSAYRQLPQQQLAEGIVMGSNIYRDGSLASAYGRRGWGGTTSATGGSAGSYS